VILAFGANAVFIALVHVSTVEQFLAKILIIGKSMQHVTKLLLEAMDKLNPENL
jgi:hypothetical protein